MGNLPSQNRSECSGSCALWERENLKRFLWEANGTRTFPFFPSFRPSSDPHHHHRPPATSHLQAQMARTKVSILSWLCVYKFYLIFIAVTPAARRCRRLHSKPPASPPEVSFFACHFRILGRVAKSVSSLLPLLQARPPASSSPPRPLGRPPRYAARRRRGCRLYRRH